MAELVDALVSNTSGSDAVWVRFPLRVQSLAGPDDHASRDVRVLTISVSIRYRLRVH